MRCASFFANIMALCMLKWQSWTSCIMVRLSDVNNVDTLLSELKEYTIQLDWGFYRLR